MNGMVCRDLDALIASIERNDKITVQLEEGERQMVLMALAALAIERPGWDYALTTIAMKMDTVQTVEQRHKQRHLDALRHTRSSPAVAIGKPMMYETFKAFRSQGLAQSKGQLIPGDSVRPV